jgi:hypothetical protein
MTSGITSAQVHSIHLATGKSHGEIESQWSQIETKVNNAAQQIFNNRATENSSNFNNDRNFDHLTNSQREVQRRDTQETPPNAGSNRETSPENQRPNGSSGNSNAANQQAQARANTGSNTNTNSQMAQTRNPDASSKDSSINGKQNTNSLSQSSLSSNLSNGANKVSSNLESPSQKDLLSSGKESASNSSNLKESRAEQTLSSVSNNPKAAQNNKDNLSSVKQPESGAQTKGASNPQTNNIKESSSTLTHSKSAETALKTTELATTVLETKNLNSKNSDSPQALNQQMDQTEKPGFSSKSASEANSSIQGKENQATNNNPAIQNPQQQPHDLTQASTASSKKDDKENESSSTQGILSKVVIATPYTFIENLKPEAKQLFEQSLEILTLMGAEVLYKKIENPSNSMRWSDEADKKRFVLESLEDLLDECDFIVMPSDTLHLKDRAQGELMGLYNSIATFSNFTSARVNLGSEETDYSIGVQFIAQKSNKKFISNCLDLFSETWQAETKLKAFA